jgi:hypothetical protein
MSNLNNIPSEFQVLSTKPELRIQYLMPLGSRIFLFLFFLPFFVVFILHLWSLFLAVRELANLRFWQAMQMLGYNSNDPWQILLFVFTFSLLGVAFGSGMWCILGVTEVWATHQSLTISYKLLGFSRNISVSSRNIRYFNQFLNTSSEGYFWEVEVVTNQRRFDKYQSFPVWIPAKPDMVTRLNYKTIPLYSHTNPNPSKWLGRVLADFYRVEFQSTAQSKNSVTYRPH